MTKEWRHRQNWKGKRRVGKNWFSKVKTKWKWLIPSEREWNSDQKCITTTTLWLKHTKKHSRFETNYLSALLWFNIKSCLDRIDVEMFLNFKRCCNTFFCSEFHALSNSTNGFRLFWLLKISYFSTPYKVKRILTENLSYFLLQRH